MAKAKVKVGDTVRWSSPGGEAEGKVEKRLTAPTEIKGHAVKASKDDPQLLVRSAKGGGTAAHRPEALRKA